MKFTLILLALVMASTFSDGQNSASQSHDGSLKGKPKEVVNQEGFSIPVYDFEGFKPILHPDDDTTYVINFWATWCKPCVEEIPDFLRLSEELDGKKIRFIYVSLDFRRNLESGVIPFIKARGMKEGVVMLHDPDADKWIGQVSEAWSGAIPATLVIRGDKKEFFESKLHYTELKSIVQLFLNL